MLVRNEEGASGVREEIFDLLGPERRIEGQTDRADREDGEVEEEDLHPLRELNGDTVAFADA
jgi:hypothetical protein